MVTGMARNTVVNGRNEVIVGKKLNGRIRTNGVGRRRSVEINLGLPGRLQEIIHGRFGKHRKNMPADPVEDQDLRSGKAGGTRADTKKAKELVSELRINLDILRKK